MFGLVVAWDGQVEQGAHVAQFEDVPTCFGDLLRNGPAEDGRGQAQELVLELLIGHRVVGRAEIVGDVALERPTVPQGQDDAGRVLALLGVGVDADPLTKPGQFRVGDPLDR